MTIKPTGSVSTVTTLKASIEDTLSFVNYHLNSGIDHMYLFFDDPKDRAIEALRGYKRVSAFLCDNNHWSKNKINPESGIQIKQTVNATLALTIAKKAGFKWLIHIDVDELLYGPDNISSYLDRIDPNVDVVRFTALEATPQKMDYDNPYRDIRFFKHYRGLSPKKKRFTALKIDQKRQSRIARVWHLKRKIAKIMGSKHARREKFLYGHQSGKCAVRTSLKAESLKCHLPIPAPGSLPRIAISENYCVLHYDCTGLEGWKKKWKKRLTGENYHDSKFHSQERVQFASKINTVLNSEHKTQELYRDMYYLTLYEMFLLRALGLVKRVKISKDKFSLNKT